MEQEEQYRYWERPWVKWVILVTALMQFVVLWMNVKEYQTMQAVDIFSPKEWAKYAAAQQMRCTINAILGVCFLAIFLIGCFAKTKRCAKICEGVLLLLAGVSLGVAQAVIFGGVQALWLCCTLLALGGAFGSFYQALKAPPKEQ